MRYPREDRNDFKGEKERSSSGVPVEPFPYQTKPKRSNCEGGEDRYKRRKENRNTENTRRQGAERKDRRWVGRRSGDVVSSVHVAKGAMVGLYEVAMVVLVAAAAAVVVVGVGPVWTDTHFSSFLSVSPSEAVVSSVSASAPVLVLLLAETRLVVELVVVLAPITTVATRGLSLAS